MKAAKEVTTPTFLYQVRDDVSTVPSDVQSIFDALPTQDKDLLWVRGTTRRWDGYTYFQKEPKQVLQWFARHMS